MFKRDPPALAMETDVGKTNPRWVKEEEDDAAEGETNDWIRVFILARRALFISTY
jgi:hypothetical protein